MSRRFFTDGKTVVDAEFLNSFYGGVSGHQEGSIYYDGHVHDGYSSTEWGHAGKIDLTDHVRGRLVLPKVELKSLKLSSKEAIILADSLYWVVAVPNDGYDTLIDPSNYQVGEYPMLQITWAANNSSNGDAIGDVAFSVRWQYIEIGQNVIAPSRIEAGVGGWPANTEESLNPECQEVQFLVNDVISNIAYINSQRTKPLNEVVSLRFPVLNGNPKAFSDYLLLGVEVSTYPTLALGALGFNPMQDIYIYGIDIKYLTNKIGLVPFAVEEVVDATDDLNDGP